MRRALYTHPERDGAPLEDARTGLAAGFLAMVPLLVAYEWGLAVTGGARRNGCVRSPRPTGWMSTRARW